MNLKYLPFALLSAFGVKYLVIGIDVPGVLCLAVLGITCFCLEKIIENNNINNLSQKYSELLITQKKQADELETMKSYTNSLRLNGLRNGNNRPAQQ